MNEKKRAVERGYGKINLHLDITGRLPDGYHAVETVMQTVSLYDEVTVILREGTTVDAECNLSGVPTDEKNLAVRAALLFFERTGFSSGVHLAIEKRIPMAAGMAGGSADAAATLRGLNRLFDAPLTTEELCELGSRLGADVPFCVVGGTAYADGKGDRLHPFPSMPDCRLVIACEGEGVSTPWAYGLLDRRYENFASGASYVPRSTENLKQALIGGALPDVARWIYNIFEEPVLAERPVAEQIRRTLLESGALGAMMSGSGPSVFGIFADDDGAARAMTALTSLGFRPYGCQPVKPLEG